MTIVKNNPDFSNTDSSEPTPVDKELANELEGEQSQDVVEQEEQTPEQDNNEEQEETQEEPIQQKVEAPSKVKIGEQEFSNEELQEIVNKGSKIKEWEKKMPGFNIDTFMPDYTTKSQRLKEYEKRFAPKESKQNLDELKELGVDEDQINAFQKVAKHLGFVRQTDLVQDSVEVQKESFIARHPEYAPGTPVNDQKWSTLMEEFSLFNWQQHPEKVEKLLEKAHEEVSKSWIETERGQKVKQNITTIQAKANAAAIGGNGVGKGVTTLKSDNSTIEKYRAMGWSENDIKEILN